MESRGIIAIVVGIAFLVLLGLWLVPRVSEELAPQLRAAAVAIEVEGSGVAVIGPAEIERGTDFTLHGVLIAAARDGAAVYYTRAPRLRVDGTEVPAAALRRWDRPQHVKVRWFSVEGGQLFRKVGPDEDLSAAFALESIFRPEWPEAWSIPGEISSSNDNLEDLTRQRDFGTQRYQVRFETYEDSESLLPRQRFDSPGPQSLTGESAHFPTVFQALPGRIAPASLVFGLSQLELPPDPSSDQLAAADALARKHLAFTRLTVLRDLLQTAGRRFEQLSWRGIDLRGEISWEKDAMAGDLLRVGERVVVLYEDRGTLGVVDYGDLCFEFVQGASIRPLGEVFEGDGLVELASLGQVPGV